MSTLHRHQDKTCPEDKEHRIGGVATQGAPLVRVQLGGELGHGLDSQINYYQEQFQIRYPYSDGAQSAIWALMKKRKTLICMSNEF
jgi:hypothetical protein